MKKAAQPCNEFVSVLSLPSWNTTCQSCGWDSSRHAKLSVDKVREQLVFYDGFPKTGNIFNVVRRRVPKHTNITDMTVCAELRHTFTNYEKLSRSQRWNHDELKAEVNRLILERIGDWRKGGSL